MKIAVGKVVECFVFLPTLTLNWIKTNEGSIYFLQLVWLFWYIECSILSDRIKH